MASMEFPLDGVDANMDAADFSQDDGEGEDPPDLAIDPTERDHGESQDADGHEDRSGLLENGWRARKDPSSPRIAPDSLYLSRTMGRLNALARAADQRGLYAGPAQPWLGLCVGWPCLWTMLQSEIYSCLLPGAGTARCWPLCSRTSRSGWGQM